MRSVLYAVSIVLLTTFVHADDPAARRPNVVVILADDLGYGDLGCFGHPRIKTPHLDRMARDGMRLTNCYAAAPVCSPSRAGMLTGRIPNRAGIYDWIPARSPMHLKTSEITLATLLKGAGYQTCHVGKWHCNGHFNSPEQPQPGDHGFDHWFATQNNAAPSHHNPVNFVRNGEKVGPLTGYSSGIIVQEGIDWLRKRDRNRPFLLTVWFHNPHEPIATGSAYVDAYAREARTPQEAEYFGNVAEMDHEVGQLLRALDEDGLRDGTLVYFSSDNGPETLGRYKGSERSYGSPGSLRGMKLHMYEGGLRVPGIIRWPGHVAPGQVSDVPVASYDLLPTVCDLAGVPVPADRALDGVSLTAFLKGGPLVRKRPLYWQYDRAIGSNRIALRDGDWKLLANADLSKFELYNLRDDVSESRDLSSTEPARLEQLVRQLRERRDEVRAESPQWPVGPGTK